MVDLVYVEMWISHDVWSLTPSPGGLANPSLARHRNHPVDFSIKKSTVWILCLHPTVYAQNLKSYTVRTFIQTDPRSLFIFRRSELPFLHRPELLIQRTSPFRCGSESWVLSLPVACHPDIQRKVLLVGGNNLRERPSEGGLCAPTCVGQTKIQLWEKLNTSLK